MNTTSVTLETLVNRVILRLENAVSRPLTTTVVEALDADDTSLTVADATGINVSDIIEIDDEAMLVTAKTSDTVPVFTVSRGYYFSTAATHSANDVVNVNPRYPRVRVAEAVRSAFGRMEALGLPMVAVDTFNRVTDKKYISMPAATREVLSVTYVATDGRVWELDGWSFFDTMDESTFATGKVLRLPRYIQNGDDIQVISRIPYRWSNHPSAPVAASTMTMYEGTDDIPVLYACAWLLASREISRVDIDRAEEWNQGEPSRGGVSASVLRLQWQEFYRALDEARRLVPSMPLHRQYRRMPRLTK